MNSAPKIGSPWWCDLQQTLAGSFTARGLLTTKFALLDSEGKKFGRLQLRGPSMARFESGGHTASLMQIGRSYRMVVEGEVVLTATPKGQSVDELEISCGSQTYETRVSFFRNLAVACSVRDGGRMVRVSGTFVGQSYQILFAPEDGCTLPASVFLLWHLVANRRRAYRLGSQTRGGAM